LHLSIAVTSRAPRGPAKVATGVRVRFGQESLSRFYTAFGEKVFDVWRRPSAAEYHEVIRAALAEVGLPANLEDAMESDDYDAPMRVSHHAGVSLVGSEAGRRSPPSTAWPSSARC
jgi:hypothetical protein